MLVSQSNPYIPMPMRVLRSYAESADGTLRTLELGFENKADHQRFFDSFVRGNSARSVFEQGKRPGCVPMLPGKAILCALPSSGWAP